MPVSLHLEAPYAFYAFCRHQFLHTYHAALAFCFLVLFCHACTHVLCHTLALVHNGSRTCVFKCQLPPTYAFSLVLRCPCVLGVLRVVIFRFVRCLQSRCTRSCARTCFCQAIVRPLCFYDGGAMPAMPAPLYPATHSQWLQKGGKLGEWKHLEKMKHNTFVVFQIKQTTSMCVCLHIRLASRLAPLSPPPHLTAQRGGMPDWSIGRRKGPRTGTTKMASPNTKRCSMCSTRFFRSLFRCPWSCLVLCATRFARSGRCARFV